jgi:hypothetical protein
MRTLNALATDDNPKIVILPWLALSEPADYAGVRLLPRPDAIEHGRTFEDVDVSEHVKCATSYTNAVVFERYVQTLVQRPEYIVPMSRQMYGVKTTGTRAINLLATRPHRCGEFQPPEQHHWEAITRAIDDRSGARVMDAVRKVVAATQDIDVAPSGTPLIGRE